jgi:hypothetical protein
VRWPPTGPLASPCGHLLPQALIRPTQARGCRAPPLVPVLPPADLGVVPSGYNLTPRPCCGLAHQPIRWPGPSPASACPTGPVHLHRPARQTSLPLPPVLVWPDRCGAAWVSTIKRQSRLARMTRGPGSVRQGTSRLPISFITTWSLGALRVDSILGALRVDSMPDVLVVACHVRAARPMEGIDGPSRGQCRSPAVVTPGF